MFLLLAAAGVVNYFGTQSAIRHATASAASIVQLCQSQNEQNTRQRILWDHILTMSAGTHQPHETATQKHARDATARAFKAYIHRVFAPRDCANLTAP